jgi:pyruvate carboxylase
MMDNSIKKSTEQVKLADLNNKKHVGSSMPGSVSKVLVKKGDTVVLNQPLIVIEAMKMETSIAALTSGIVEELLVREGQVVRAGELLATLQ